MTGIVRQILSLIRSGISRKGMQVSLGSGFVLCFFTVFAAGLSAAAVPMIKAVDIEDYRIAIRVDGPINYSIQVPDDPFRIVVSIEGVAAGAATQKIVSTNAGISEIASSKSATYATGTDLNILLRSPSNIRSEVIGDSLVLSLEGAAPRAGAKARAQAGGNLTAKRLSGERKEASTEAIALAAAAPAAEPAATAAAASEPDPAVTAVETPPAVSPQPESLVKGDDTARREVQEVTFERDDQRVALIFRANGLMPEPRLYRGVDRLIVEIPGVAMKADLPKDLVPPVRELIHTETDSGSVRMLVMHDQKVRTEAYTIDDEIVIAFFAEEPKTTPPAAQAAPAVPPSATGLTVPSRDEKKTAAPSATSAPLASAPQTPPANGNNRNGNGARRLNLEFQDAELVSILKTLSDVGGYNIIIHPDVKGKVTMKLTDVTWEQALDSIVKTFGLARTVDGTIIRIMPQALVAKENEEAFKAKELAKKNEPLETRHYPVHYNDVYAMEQAIKEAKVLSDRGSISAVAAPAKDRQQADGVDKFSSPKSSDRFFRKRAGVLIITDIPLVFPTVERLVAELDKRIPQVLIEARIVEIDTALNRDLGVDWNIQYNAPNTLSAIGAMVPFSPIPAAGTYINRPEVTNTGTYNKASNLTFGMISPAGTLSVDAKLSAIEGANKGQVISAPKILTTVNEKARILQGRSIPYVKEVSKEGVASVDFKDVAIVIDVTPNIGPNNTVLLNVTTTKEDLLQFKQVAGGAEAPLTSKIEGSTSVIVENGGTFVVGGIYKKQETTTDTGTPWIKDVPVLGWLFKTEQKRQETREMMIFLTPKIIDNVQSVPEAQTVFSK